MARPGKAPASTKEISPGVWLARGKHLYPVHPRSSVPAAHRVSVTSPRTGLASGKLPTRLRSVPCAPTRSHFLIPIYHRRLHLHVPDSAKYIVWPAETGPTINSYNNKHLYTFPDIRITLHCSNTTLYTTPDNYNKHRAYIYFQVFAGWIH